MKPIFCNQTINYLILMSPKLSRYCADTARDTSWNRKLLNRCSVEIRVSNSDFLPQTCTFGCRDWFSVSAKSCPVWWCGRCARRYWSSPGEPSGWAWQYSSWSCPSCLSPRCTRDLEHPRWNNINIKLDFTAVTWHSLLCFHLGKF